MLEVAGGTGHGGVVEVVGAGFEDENGGGWGGAGEAPSEDTGCRSACWSVSWVVGREGGGERPPTMTMSNVSVGRGAAVVWYGIADYNF